ncbi:DUF397 domain-containing protein [Streptomyces griseocarneus]|uniref:DUF397 domain-containing protein n=1 Tax=Streptomyces griseocarneus TaxID=51201 RepID=UPI00167C70FE|nr:DUF397 domain-containing protein [Streptomyces griseocarneus]MBZ6472557.1 DUF397 domain-containing protein [Streptomyces griseocarneus]GHG45915.1 hypothetical protein GCM10018779_02140 [Streptomyces griseocarneus]
MNTTIDLSAAKWRTSSYTNGDGGNCVEIADNLPGIVPVRDTKTAPQGTTLVFPATAWAVFVRTLKR